MNFIDGAQRALAAPLDLHGFVDDFARYLAQPNLTSAEKAALLSDGCFRALSAAQATVPALSLQRAIAVLDIVRIGCKDWDRVEKGFELDWDDLFDAGKVCYDLYLISVGPSPLPNSLELTSLLPSLYLIHASAVEAANIYRERQDPQSIGEMREQLGIEGHGGNGAVPGNLLALLTKVFKQRQLTHLEERIPDLLEDDEVLKDWKCALSDRPVRFPSVIQIRGRFDVRNGGLREKVYLCDRKILEDILYRQRRGMIPRLFCQATDVRVLTVQHSALTRLIEDRLGEIDRQMALHRNLNQVPRGNPSLGILVLEGLGDFCDRLKEKSDQLEREAQADGPVDIVGQIGAKIGKIAAWLLRGGVLLPAAGIVGIANMDKQVEMNRLVSRYVFSPLTLRDNP